MPHSSATFGWVSCQFLRDSPAPGSPLTRCFRTTPATATGWASWSSRRACSAGEPVLLVLTDRLRRADLTRGQALALAVDHRLRLPASARLRPTSSRDDAPPAAEDDAPPDEEALPAALDAPPEVPLVPALDAPPLDPAIDAGPVLALFAADPPHPANATAAASTAADSATRIPLRCTTTPLLIHDTRSPANAVPRRPTRTQYPTAAHPCTDRRPRAPDLLWGPQPVFARVGLVARPGPGPPPWTLLGPVGRADAAPGNLHVLHVLPVHVPQPDTVLGCPDDQPRLVPIGAHHRRPRYRQVALDGGGVH